MRSGLAIILTICLPALQTGAEIVYETDFDDLSVGVTQPYPGDPGHDGWYAELAVGDAFGEVQNAVAEAGNALHEHADITSTSGTQTIDRLSLVPPDLQANPIITLSADFYCASSDLDITNPYSALLEVTGGPHPGFNMIGFALNGGNGSPKSLTGVNVGVSAFDGTNNHFAIPLTVGQQLAWNTWHHVTLVADQSAGTWVSITVDDGTQELDAFLLPHSFDGESWVRGQLIEVLSAQVVPIDWPDEESSDEVYWDNVCLTVDPLLPPEVVYVTDFDGLTLGYTQPHPGDPGHDGWFSELALGDAYGEIQEAIADEGNALHEHTDVTNATGQQTIDRRAILPPDLEAKPKITLSVDFYCASSDLSLLNAYTAGLEATGGPHPGFLITGFALTGGNGMPKIDTGINVAITAFDGVGNHFGIPLAVGQQLDWSTWHSLTLVANQGRSRWESVRVDGDYQDLREFRLPRSWDGTAWLRGLLMEMLSAQIIPNDFPEDESSDEVYWENLRLTVEWVEILPGDFDDDGDADLSDFAQFVDCLAGPDESPAPSAPGVETLDCQLVFDADEDGDVDLQDAAFFANAFTGSW